MSVLYTMDVINKTRGTIVPQYDAGYQNVLGIRNNSRCEFDLICNGFVFGYAQGMKAAKAQMKRKVS